MKKIEISQFTEILKGHNFLKYKKNYYRIVNDKIFQSIGLTYCKGLNYVRFCSFVLECDEITLDELFMNEKYYDGFNLSEIVGIKSECTTKKEAISLITEEMLERLDSLIDVNTHINYYQNGLFCIDNSSCEVPFYYYLYIKDYDKVISLIENNIQETIDSIVSARIITHTVHYIFNDRLNNNYTYLEEKYHDVENMHQFLSDLYARKNFDSIFKDIYNSNINNLKAYFGEKIFEKLRMKNV